MTKLLLIRVNSNQVTNLDAKELTNGISEQTGWKVLYAPDPTIDRAFELEWVVDQEEPRTFGTMTEKELNELWEEASADQNECSHCESCFKWFVEVNEPWDVPIKYSKKWKETKEQPEIEELDYSRDTMNQFRDIEEKINEIIRYLNRKED